MAVLISALQRNASEVIRKVRATGMAVEITDRGRVVAILSPPPEETGVDRLRNAGVVLEPMQGSIEDVLNSKITLAGAADALREQRDSDSSE